MCSYFYDDKHQDASTTMSAERSDYDRIASAINYVTQHVIHQPGLDDIAAHLNLSRHHFQRLFSRWVGVTPKRYLQILTVERAKRLLASTSVLEVADSLGLSSGSRLYDHFITLEAVSPGEFKSGGAGMLIEYASCECPFGRVFIATTQRGICKMSFMDDLNEAAELAELSHKWPAAQKVRNAEAVTELVQRIFQVTPQADRPISLYVSGTNFQVSVWKALLSIPSGTVQSYNNLANALNRPRSARAVGTAIGANPVAFLIPCHRVIRSSGELGGYHWGTTRMHAIHAWESAINDGLTDAVTETDHTPLLPAQT